MSHRGNGGTYPIGQVANVKDAHAAFSLEGAGYGIKMREAVRSVARGVGAGAVTAAGVLLACGCVDGSALIIATGSQLA